LLKGCGVLEPYLSRVGVHALVIGFGFGLGFEANPRKAPSSCERKGNEALKAGSVFLQDVFESSFLSFLLSDYTIL